jgi:hypothetical protein
MDNCARQLFHMLVRQTAKSTSTVERCPYKIEIFGSYDTLARRGTSAPYLFLEDYKKVLQQASNPLQRFPWSSMKG